MEASRDRRAKLAAQKAANGIDFVEVLPGQTHLRVHFVNPLPDATALKAAIHQATITGGEPIAEVSATLEGWGSDAAHRPWLELSVESPGDFSTYTLRLLPETGLLDRFFNHITFSFKADCPSTLDCETPAPVCPPDTDSAPPIDYLAKDFESFRKALSDFSALRYPAWQERSEADFGVMFMEALCSVADDLSYLQDRIAAEAWLETATERRSLVRLARLVDYEPRPATAARVWLAFEMASLATGPIPAGLRVSAQAPDGTAIDFETGTGLADETIYPARREWNTIQPYWWDDGELCLPHGATEMWIVDPGPSLQVGRSISIDTAATFEADPPVRQIVKLVAVDKPTTDPLYDDVPVVRIAWRAEDALTADHDLTRTRVCANVVPATQGRRATDRFVTSRQRWTTPGVTPRALVRAGANGTPQFLHPLREGPLAWLAPESGDGAAQPELRVSEISSAGRVWSFRTSLLDALDEAVVTVEPMSYRPTEPSIGAFEYDGSDGDTLRFGDGVFGRLPADGAVFQATYRRGGGAIGNVAAGAIDRFDRAHPVGPQITAVTNPCAGWGGRDEETLDKVRERAPQDFRARLFRAVRPEDYEQAAVTLPWVQRAGTVFRWTGSWLTVFTAADPLGSESLAPDRAAELTDLLNRRRMAGYESYVLAPRYASLDLDVTICARPDAFRGEVKRAVLAALDTSPHVDGTRGFFHPDRFTFGMGLERSEVEAAIQSVSGVDGVVAVRYRRRGHTPGFVDMPDLVTVARDEIVRVDSNPSRPERGSLRIDVVGGK